MFSVCFFKLTLLERNVHYSYTLLIFEEQNTGTLQAGLKEQKKFFLRKKNYLRRKSFQLLRSMSGGKIAILYVKQ